MTDTTTQSFNQASKPLKAAVWVLQIFLTACFLFVGWIQLTTPLTQLHRFIPWFAGMPAGIPRAIGAVEILAALALLFPSVLRLKPGLSILAAALLTMAMFIAVSMHYVHGEYAVIPYPAVLAALSGYVALMRMTRAQITPRTTARSQR